MRTKAAFLAGIGTAYFFDPRAGKKRRHELRDRSLRALRRISRVGLKKTKLAGGRLQGLAALARRSVTRPDVAVDDETVAQRIRSDALRDVGLSTRDVDVTVQDGFAKLRGSVENTDIAERLVSRVRQVAGVSDVSAELRVTE